MRFETSENLRQLEDAPWFARVGRHDDDTKVAVVLTSWREAVEYCSSLEWENIRLEIANRFRERLLAVSTERFCKWNEVVDEIKPVTMDLVRRKIAPFVLEHDLPKDFGDAVDWDILHLCMESEYVDLVPPGFYSGLAYWYANGHFPCGWQNGVPRGRPIIY